MRLRTAAVILALLQAGCAATNAPGPVSPQAGGRADDFLVVDCLLPGQIRQLGTSMTYVSARRAVKTSARECQIRGGEYTAFDRANYASALRVWLPLAEQGDPAAQTNVGEIYEKGLGVAPDHAAAAQWYRRAADKGYSRAAINLGNLYEQGLGVPKDSTQALNWYRRASGLKDLTFGAPTGEELERLRRENAGLRKDLEAKQAELERTQRELEDARRSLEQRRGEVDAERTRLAEVRLRLQESQQRQQAGTARVKELEDSITKAEGRLAAKERDATTLETLQRQAAEMRAQLEESQRQQQAGAGRVQDLERAVAEAESRLTAKEKELAAVRTASAASTEDLRRQAGVERQGLDRMRAELTQVQTDAQASRARASELERSVRERESQLALRDRELADLRVKVTKLEEDASARVRALEGTRQKAAGTPPEIQLIEPEVIATRDKTPSVQAASGELTLVGRVLSERGIMSLTLNGREQALDAANLFKSKLNVSTPDQRVRIVAIDRDGRKSLLDFVIRQRDGKPAVLPVSQGSGVGHPAPQAPIAFGKYHALVIGNNDYKMMPRLKTAVSDAQEMARILGAEYGFNVQLLLNATRYDILAALNDLRGKLGPNDNLLIYYAGHGELDEKNQRGHWLPVDAEPDSTANWISNIQITDVLNAMTVRQLLVVADSCYAGTMTRAAVTQLAGGMTEEDRMKSMQVMAQARSRMVMTSGGVEPVLDSGAGKHSVFAQSFLDLLQKNDGVLTGQELFNLLRLRVVALAGRVDLRQVPEYAPIKFAGHESGDFFFVRRSN